MRPVALLAFVPFILATQASIPSSLQTLVDSERAFAAEARSNGWRAAFIEFFSADAITFTPDPTPVQPRLRSAPNRPPSEDELNWEPRAGDISASDDLGWLTGPSTHVDHTAGAPPDHGNYFSIWKRQPDGRWRVYIDVGTRAPADVPFAAGFTRASMESRFTASPAAAKDSLLTVDRALNTDIERLGPAAGYARFVSVDARLHRNGTGTMPAVGRDAISKWFAEHPEPFKPSTTDGEASRAGDLGFTYGKYEIGVTPPHSGAYIRMWARRSDGSWVLQVDAIVPVN
jgi:ketosteroid isomerase-like protein